MPRPPLEIGTWGKISAPVQLPNGLWKVTARYRDTDGVTRKVEATHARKSQAEPTLKRRLEARRTPASSAITPDSMVRDLVPLWWAELEERGRADNTLKRYRITLDQHVLKARGGVGNLRLRECTTWRMNEFLQGIRRDHGAASAKVAKTVLTGLLSLAARYEAITANPLREVAPITVKRKAVRALAEADVRRLRKALGEWQAAPAPSGKPRPDDLRDVIDVMLATGCRISEALGVRWADVDLDAGKVSINGAVIVADDGIKWQDHPKSRGSVQTYTVDGHTVAMLRARWDKATEHGLVPRMVFPSATGTLRDPSNYRKQWRTARQAIGFDWVTPHTFRKTVATRLANEAGLKAASEYLGHSSEAITSAHYRQRSHEAADMTGALAGFWSEEEAGDGE